MSDKLFSDALVECKMAGYKNWEEVKEGREAPATEDSVARNLIA